MYEHRQYRRHVNLTRFTVRLKREKKLKIWYFHRMTVSSVFFGGGRMIPAAWGSHCRLQTILHRYVVVRDTNSSLVSVAQWANTLSEPQHLLGLTG